MATPVTVLLHSPLVGPTTWRTVATHLAETGQPSVVPDLSGALGAGPPLHQAVADEVARHLRAAGANVPLVLVGHSGAGPLLPRIARTVRQPVAAVVYVDAVLPYPGEPWTANAPPDLVTHLRALVHDGLLPPWHEWFPPEAISDILPDPAMRDAFTRELPRVPFAYLSEPASADTWTGPAGYLLLSDGYREDAAAARHAGMPVVEHVEHHLAMLTAPAAVGAALLDLIGQSLAGAPSTR